MATKFTEPVQIGRLDRAALVAGIELTTTTKHGREFTIGERTYRYKPQGKGVVMLEVYIENDLEAYHVCHPDRVIKIWEKVT